MIEILTKICRFNQNIGLLPFVLTILQKWALLLRLHIYLLRIDQAGSVFLLLWKLPNCHSANQTQTQTETLPDAFRAHIYMKWKYRTLKWCTALDLVVTWVLFPEKMKPLRKSWIRAFRHLENGIPDHMFSNSEPYVSSKYLPIIFHFLAQKEVIIQQFGRKLNAFCSRKAQTCWFYVMNASAHWVICVPGFHEILGHILDSFIMNPGKHNMHMM